MFHKVIGIIRRANQPTGIQAYYNSIQRGRATSGPTYDEARRDFKNSESTRYQSFGRLG
ncbi:MAG: hypothetical protein IIC24_02685 [Chloroflexi bacterium]|nr:hypothetical protein [Chloroflexota bacterium]